MNETQKSGTMWGPPSPYLKMDDNDYKTEGLKVDQIQKKTPPKSLIRAPSPASTEGLNTS